MIIHSSLGFGLAAIVFLSIAMATEYWLFTVEPSEMGNVVSKFGEVPQTETSELYLWTGLWRVCSYQKNGMYYLLNN